MYKLISIISVFLRTFIFLNPFTGYFQLGLSNTPLNTSSEIIAGYFNFIIGGAILCSICYPLVGIIYDRGKFPVIGSLLYLGVILLNSKILVWISNTMTNFDFEIFLLIFVICITIEIIIFNFIRYIKVFCLRKLY